MASGAGAIVVGLLSSSTLVCRGLSSVAAMVVVCGTSCGGTRENISGMRVGRYSARQIAVGLSLALNKLASGVHWILLSLQFNHTIIGKLVVLDWLKI